MELSLRRPRPDDAAAMAALMSHPEVQPWLLQLPHVSAESWRQRFSTPADVQSADLQLLAFDGERLVGSAGLHTWGTAQRRRHVMSLGMGVLPAAQGQGVGKALMQALVTQADDWLGVLRLELTVFCDNARAIALYQRFGFETEGRHRAYALRAGRYVDCFAMARLHPNPPGWDAPEAASAGQ